ncbi:MAG TPA: metallophosphoesterase family protein [Gemmatimonadales bacterium]|nr:metallophosphoesterase family protein [Gemmatimonadales bacterium]
MRLALIADIHANAPALEAVLVHARRQRVDLVVGLGDIVGTSALPLETIAMMRDQGIESVAGNHDLAAIGRLSLDLAGPRAREVLEWTRDVLSDQEWRYLAELPMELAPRPEVLCIHAGFSDPVATLRTADDFRAQARLIREYDPRVSICCLGHTHLPGVVSVVGSEVYLYPGPVADLPTEGFHFVNPGSVGDLTTRDPRAVYATLDLDERRVRYFRVPYDRGAVLSANTRQRTTAHLLEQSA